MGRLGRADPFGHLAYFAEDRLERFPLGELETDLPISREISRACKKQISKARQSRKGEGVRALLDADSRDFRQRPRNQRGPGVQAEPEAVGRARGDGHDVFQGARQLDSDYVVAGEKLERIGVTNFLHRSRRADVVRGHG